MENTMKYIHDEHAHNLEDPQIIVPIILDVLKPKSVIDVGCGIGTFLNVLKRNGVNDILGLDGTWVNKDLLSKNISLDYFREANLEVDVDLGRRFDIAICLEVVEHLTPESSEKIVETLTKLSDMIIFSSAIPGQGGQNHINEQWPEYWMQKFKKYGYTFYDVFRPIFWNNKDISRWYKQNLFLVAKNDVNEYLDAFRKYQTENIILNFIHPDYYKIRLKEIEKLQEMSNNLQATIGRYKSGKASFGSYVKMNIKYILNLFGIIN